MHDRGDVHSVHGQGRAAVNEHVADKEQGGRLDKDVQGHSRAALEPALDQVQGQVLVSVEAVGRADQGGPDQDVAQELVGEGGGVAQHHTAEDLPGAARQQGEHGQRHQETHDGVQDLFKLFHSLISSFASLGRLLDPLDVGVYLGLLGLQVGVNGLARLLEGGKIHVVDQLDALFLGRGQDLVFKFGPGGLVVLGHGAGAAGHDLALMVGHGVPGLGGHQNNIRDAGVLVKAVILGDVGMVAHGGDVVLCAVDDALLHGGVDLRIAGDRGRAAQRRHHVDGHLGVHGADLKAIQVGRRPDGGVGGVEGARARIHPGQAHKALAGGQLIQVLGDLAVHDVVVMLLVVEHVGHRQHVPLLLEVAQGGSRDLGHIQRAGADLGDVVHLAAQGRIGEDLDVDGAFRLFPDGVGKGAQRDVDRVVLGQAVGQGQLKDVLAVGVGPCCLAAAAGQCACRSHGAQGRQKMTAGNQLFHWDR